MSSALRLAQPACMLGLLAAAGAAQAQAVCCATPAATTRQGCKDGPALCVPVGETASVTIGGEYRIRFETLDRVDFGIANAPRSTSVPHRGTVSADLHIFDTAKLFVQLAAAGQSGRRPVVRPVDASDPDFAQAFIEIPGHIADAEMALRFGRQELAIGNRLIGLRDGVTLRRAFDGVRFDAAMSGHRVIAFYLSPVLNRPEAFDDRRARGENFAGLNWQFPGDVADGQWTAFVFNRQRRDARFQVASGREQRQTFGIKYQRTTARWDITAQGGFQTGSIGARDIFAWGGAVDAGWTLSVHDPVRIGFEIGVASGDRKPGDGHLGTFDPLYPNLAAFTDAPLYYYANQFNLQGNVRKISGPVTLQADMTLLARMSSRDAIYAPPGRPLVLPVGSNRLTALTFASSARWRVNRHLELYASVLHAKALDGLRAAGGEDTNFALVQITTGF